MTAHDEWIEFTHKYGRTPRSADFVATLTARRIRLSAAAYKDLGKPKQVYYRYCLNPLAVAIVPVMKPADYPKPGIGLYMVSQQTIAATDLWRFLELEIKQPQPVDGRIENSSLILELEHLKSATTE